MSPENISAAWDSRSSQQSHVPRDSQQADLDAEGRARQLEEAFLDNQSRLQHSAADQDQDQDEDKQHPEYLPDLEEVKTATNEVLARMNIQLDFKMDYELEQIVIKVKNSVSGEVIRQMPPQEVMEMARRMEEMSGMLLNRWG